MAKNGLTLKLEQSNQILQFQADSRLQKLERKEYIMKNHLGSMAVITAKWSYPNNSTNPKITVSSNAGKLSVPVNLSDGQTNDQRYTNAVSLWLEKFDPYSTLENLARGFLADGTYVYVWLPLK